MLAGMWAGQVTQEETSLVSWAVNGMGDGEIYFQTCTILFMLFYNKVELDHLAIPPAWSAPEG